MRYTTIIDLRDYPELYANLNIRIVYLHLCLVSGYHDEDRDICNDSLRQLSRQCKITLSAARNALRQLAKAGLLQREGDALRVTKWVPQKPISKRAQPAMSKGDSTQANLAAIRQQEADKRDAEERRYQQRRAELEGQGLDMRDAAMIDTIVAACQGDAAAQDACARHHWKYGPQYTRDEIYKAIVKFKAASGHGKCIEICKRNKWRYEQLQAAAS